MQSRYFILFLIRNRNVDCYVEIYFVEYRPSFIEGLLQGCQRGEGRVEEASLLPFTWGSRRSSSALLKCSKTLFKHSIRYNGDQEAIYE